MKNTALIRRLFRWIIAMCLAISLIKLIIPRLIFYPDRSVDTSSENLRLPFQEFYVTTPDQIRIHGWWLKAQQPISTTNYLVIVCHGNGGNISHRLDLAASLLEIGCDVILFDYRGYGKSAGAPTEQGTYIDAETIYELSLSYGYKPEQIILYGESLGGAVATELALRRETKGLILQSTFTSIADMAKHLYPWLPFAHALVGNIYNTKSKLSQIRTPLLILHSPSDTLVPFYMAKTNYEVANHPKTLIELEGDHNDPVHLSSVFKSNLRTFLMTLATNSSFLKQP